VTQIQVYEAPEPAQEPEAWRDFGRWLNRNAVTLGAFALIAGQVWWKAVTLSHAYFQQDDLVIGGQAANSLSLHYLFQVYAGHLQPGAFALAWAAVHLSGYDWGLWAGVLLLLQTLAGFALLRALRTLFGNRPAILVPLAVFLFTPMTVPALTWWSAGVQSIPLELALPLAVDQHVRYARGGGIRHAVFAAAWILFGLAFFEKAVAIPLFLFALTSAFIVPGHWRRAAVVTLRRHWPAWAMYVGAVAIEIVVYALQLHTSAASPRMPRAGDAVGFGWGLISGTFVPAALGGPWGWSAISALYAHALPPSWPLRLSWVAGALIVIASLWYRRQAWRAWAILLGWLIVVDVVPVALGRVWAFGLDLVRETLYVADAAPVLAICLALAFLPLAGEQQAYRARPPGRGAVLRLGAAAAALWLFGSFWSVNAYQNHLRPSASRSYLATAAAALAAAPAHTIIYPSPLPSAMIWSLFGQGSNTQHALAPLAVQASGKKISWTTAPQGTVQNFMIFDQGGQLHGAVVGGPHSRPHQGCWFPNVAGVTIPLDAEVLPGKWLLQVGYFAQQPVTLVVTFGGHYSQVTLAASPLAFGYVTVQGSGDAATIRTLTSGQRICIGGITVGTVQPASNGPVLPTFPVPG
jgi:hypothetical protein